MARLTLTRANELLAEDEHDTSHTVCGRTVDNPAMRIISWHGRYVVAYWNYAHGKWCVTDTEGGYGTANDPEDAAAWCTRSESFATLREAFDNAMMCRTDD